MSVHRGLAPFLLASAALSVAADFYVSPSGDDRNPGSTARPFRTLIRAQQAVREAKKTESVHVYLRRGEYRLTEPLVLGPEDSGPVIWTAAPGEEVVITGSRKLELKWTEHRGQTTKNDRLPHRGILKASVPAGLDFDQLFVDGKRQIRARFPNYDPADPLRSGKGYQLVTDGSNRRYDTWFSFDPEIFTGKRWANPETGIVHAFQSRNWGNLQYRIKGVDWEKHLVLLGEGGWQMQRGAGIGKGRGAASPFYVENIFEELDAPGEWFLDVGSGTLYFMPPPGVDPNHAEIEAVVAKELIRFAGTPERPVRDIVLRGLTFTESGLTFLDKYEPLGRGDWAIHRGGAVFFEGAENCRVEDSNFEYVGGNAIFFSGYNRRNAVAHCRFFHTGDSAVAFAGLPKAVRMHRTWDDEDILGKPRDVTTDLQPGPKTPDYPEDCSIEDSVMSEIGDYGKQTAGVVISMSHRITVSHCTIYNTPRAGICINDGTWGGHVIEHCDIWETVRETGEHGPFNSWGRDRQWFTDSGGAKGMNKKAAFLDAVDATHIRGNRIANYRMTISAGNWTIDLDDGSSNYAIYNNLSLGSTLKLREGFYRKVWNNIFVSPVEIGWHAWPPDSEDEFYRNITVVSGARPGQDEPATGLIRPIRMPEKYPWGKRIDENLYWNVNTRRFLAGDLDWEQWREAGHDRQSVFADPQFVDPLRGDFRVKHGSPAVKIGFESFSMDEFGHRMTRIVPFGGEFEQAVAVTMKADARGGEVRYTTDGTAPARSSALYTKPIAVGKTATIRARTFRKGLPVGAEEAATFTKVSKVVRPSWLAALLQSGAPASGKASLTTRPWFGAVVRDIRSDPDLIDATGGQDYGVFLDNVPLSSKPATWGLRRSDVIVECDGKKVEDVEQLLRLTARAPRRITVIRGRRRVVIEIPPVQ